MSGTIIFRDYLSNFDAAPNTASDGRPYPETLLSILLTGSNPTPNGPTRLNIRFRDPDRLAANPTISGSDIIMDLPKHDFEMIQDMLAKSILSDNTPMQLSANYRTIDSKTWVTLSLR
ncbi:hypothetical protein ACFOSV_04890 [Algoriphagus namhaensis]|uniref:Uncharacterized protein n=1 Tax=Algoriphagus namhaensis TaxID=915353 RepID=A0ABV8ARF5_9BACT